MSNNSEETQTPIPVSQEFAAYLSKWAIEVNQFQDVADQQKTLEQIKLAYLTTTFADNTQERNNALVIFKQFDDVFKLLKGYKQKHYYQLIELTDKMLQDVL